MQFKDCSLTGLRYGTHCPGGWRLFLSLLLADNRLVPGPQGSLFCRQKWCPRWKPSGSSQPWHSLGPFFCLLWAYEESQVYITWELLWDSSQPPPSQAHDLIWIRVILENEMLKFSFPWEQCHIRQLKKTCSQHKLSIRLIGPLHYVPPCFII